MLLKYESDSSVPVLPVALILKGRNPAAVIISAGIAEQKYPMILPLFCFHFSTSGLTTVLAARDNWSNALDLMPVCTISTSFACDVLSAVGLLC